MANLELGCRQDRSTLDLHRLELVGIQSERLQNSWSDLRGLNRRVYRARRECRVRKQHDHAGVVVRETSVLLLLLATAGVNHAVVGRDDDVWSARVAAIGGKSGSIKHGRQRGPIEDFPDTRHGGIALQNREDRKSTRLNSSHVKISY